MRLTIALLDEYKLDDRAWDLLYAANRDVLERAFPDALEQIKDDERPLGVKVIAFLEAPGAQFTAGRRERRLRTSPD
jgi:hypothetical protein